MSDLRALALALIVAPPEESDFSLCRNTTLIEQSPPLASEQGELAKDTNSGKDSREIVAFSKLLLVVLWSVVVG